MRSSSSNVVLANEIRGNANGGVIVMGGQKNQIGSTNAGNLITANGQCGVYVTGMVAGTQVRGNNTISNASDGLMLVKARRLIVGGSSSEDGNEVLSNQGYGLYATGLCTGTLVQQNVFVANTQGKVNLTGSRGITYIPKTPSA